MGMPVVRGSTNDVPKTHSRLVLTSDLCFYLVIKGKP